METEENNHVDGAPTPRRTTNIPLPHPGTVHDEGIGIKANDDTQHGEVKMSMASKWDGAWDLLPLWGKISVVFVALWVAGLFAYSWLAILGVVNVSLW